MELNEGKFELLNHRVSMTNVLSQLPFQADLFNYSLPNGTILSPSHVVKDLGVHISSDLSWTNHIIIIVQAAKKMSRWVLSVFYSRECYVMKQMFKVMVRSRLEYCCVLWNPHKLEDIRLLESVQRSFTYRIAGMKGFDYWERLSKLKIMSLQRRRERYIIFTVWKILYKKVPAT